MDSLIPTDWYAKAEEDLRAARALLDDKVRLYGVAAFHIQQALEKYMKGFLLSKGWTLQRIHDLSKLLNDLVAYEPAFAKYKSLCVRVTEFYFESRYPLFPASVAVEKEVKQMLSEAEELITEIQKRIKPTT
jgi:HEPN domain-containing protein